MFIEIVSKALVLVIKGHQIHDLQLWLGIFENLDTFATSR